MNRNDPDLNRSLLSIQDNVSPFPGETQPPPLKRQCMGGADQTPNFYFGQSGNSYRPTSEERDINSHWAEFERSFQPRSNESAIYMGLAAGIDVSEAHQEFFASRHPGDSLHINGPSPYPIANSLGSDPDENELAGSARISPVTAAIGHAIDGPQLKRPYAPASVGGVSPIVTFPYSDQYNRIAKAVSDDSGCRTIDSAPGTAEAHMSLAAIAGTAGTYTNVAANLEHTESYINMNIKTEAIDSYMNAAMKSEPNNQFADETVASDPGEGSEDKEKKWVRWSEAEDTVLRAAIAAEDDPPNWKLISKKYFGGERNEIQCKNRWKKSLQPGLIKGSWSTHEDNVIRDSVENGITKWSEIARRLPGRIGDQVKERWYNCLDPTIKKGMWTPEEVQILHEQQARFGNQWSKIAQFIPGRSENSVKNRWYNEKTSRKRALKRSMAAAATTTQQV